MSPARSDRLVAILMKYWGQFPFRPGSYKGHPYELELTPHLLSIIRGQSCIPYDRRSNNKYSKCSRMVSSNYQCGPTLMNPITTSCKPHQMRRICIDARTDSVTISTAEKSTTDPQINTQDPMNEIHVKFWSHTFIFAHSCDTRLSMLYVWRWLSSGLLRHVVW
jgi:hypothetical protein